MFLSLLDIFIQLKIKILILLCLKFRSIICKNDHGVDLLYEKLYLVL